MESEQYSWAARRAAALSAAAKGEFEMPRRPMVELALLRNTLQSLLSSSPTPDEAFVAALIYYVAPMSLANIRDILGRPAKRMDALVDSGVLCVQSGADVPTRAIYRMTASWKVRGLPKREASRRPPTVEEIRRIIVWYRELVAWRRKTRGARIELPEETIGLLTWLRDSAKGKVVQNAAPPSASFVSDAKMQLAELVEETSDAGVPAPRDAWDHLCEWLFETPSFGDLLVCWPSDPTLEAVP